MNNPIRRAIQKFGIDIRQYQQLPDKLAWASKQGIKTIIDIGANTGQFAAEIRQQLPEAKIVSFEPIKECFGKLLTNMARDKNFVAYNFAIGDINGTKIMNRNAYTPSSSILPMSEAHKILFPHTRDSQPETITIKRLDDVVSSLNLAREIMIKVDVQGYEDRVLTGGQKTFAATKMIIMEISFQTLYEGQPSFDDLYRPIHGLGFVYRGSLGQKINPQSGEIISEDIIFSKQ